MTHTNSHSPLLLTVLLHVTVDRLQKAVTTLAEGSLTMTLTRQTEDEIRALVKNGEGKEYGVILTETKVFCSCPDALYRGSVYKHATTLALAILGGEIKGAKSARTIHLAMQEGTALCGVSHPLHVWKWSYWPETAWQESCTQCEALRKHPIVAKTATAAA